MFIKCPTISQLNSINPKYHNNMSFSTKDEGRILFDEKSPCKWIDSPVNFQAALYTDTNKLIVQFFPSGELYLPKPDIDNFRICFTKNYFILNYSTKFILVFKNKNICEINMQHTVQFYDNELVAYSSNYNMYHFTLKDCIFVPKIFRIQNSDNKFSTVIFSDIIEVESEFNKYVATDNLDRDFFTLYDSLDYIKFYTDEFNNKRFVLDTIKINHLSTSLIINEKTLRLREYNLLDNIFSMFALRPSNFSIQLDVFTDCL